VKVKLSKVSDEARSEGIELDLLASTFNKAVFNFCHPFGDVEFCIFVEKVSGVEFPVKLIDKIRTRQTIAVEQFPQSAASRMKSVISARHQVLVQCLGWRGC
jgi:hypothetical protein